MKEGSDPGQVAFDARQAGGNSKKPDGDIARPVFTSWSTSSGWLWSPMWKEVSLWLGACQRATGTLVGEAQKVRVRACVRTYLGRLSDLFHSLLDRRLDLGRVSAATGSAMQTRR